MKLSPPEIQQLKQDVGRKPFDERMAFNSDFAKCPFHDGDSDKSFHLYEKDGVWLATCFSSCGKTIDAIDFVRRFDKISFPQTLEKLQGRNTIATPEKQPKARMTLAAWQKWGRELTQADVDRLAKSRPNSHTATLDTLKYLGCRMKGDFIGFPYFYQNGDTLDCFTVKLRHLDTKHLLQENSISQHGFYNLKTIDAFNCGDLYIVEGELDAATLSEFGYTAISVTTGKQKEFDAKALKTIGQVSRIFLIGDSDETGRLCMDNLQRQLPPEKTYRMKLDAKDVGEFALKIGENFAQDFEPARDSATTPWVVANIPTMGTISADPPKWLIDRIFPYGGLTLFAGNFGSMKSLLALFAAYAIWSGGQFLGRKVLEPTKVLYIDRENSKNDIGVRKHRMDIPDVIHYWGDWLEDGTPNLDDPRLAEFAANGGFIVFDSFQQWLAAGMSENDNSAMTEIMRKFRRLARLGAGVLLLHHAPKYGEALYRGATGIPANTDMAIGVQKTPDGNTVQLREIRFRGCGKWEIDAKVSFGEAYSYEVLRDETAQQIVANTRVRRMDEADQLKEFVLGNPKATYRQISDNTGIALKRVSEVAHKSGVGKIKGEWANLFDGMETATAVQ